MELPRYFFFHLNEKQRTSILYSAGILDDRPDNLRGTIHGFGSDGRAWIRKNKKAIVTVLLRMNMPFGKWRSLVSQGGIEPPSEVRQFDTRIIFTTRNSNPIECRSSALDNARCIALPDLAAASAAMTELFVCIGQANRIFDPISEGEFVGSPPVVSVEAGSVQFKIGGGLFASGIALVAACSAGLVAAPAVGTVCGGSLAAAGLFDLALNWREKIAQIRKTETETKVLRLEHDKITVQQSQRLRELEIQAKELELEMARVRYNESTDAEEISYAGLVSRDLVQREAMRLGLSEGYSNYLLNVTVPLYRQLRSYFDNIQVCQQEDSSTRKT